MLLELLRHEHGLRVELATARSFKHLVGLKNMVVVDDSVIESLVDICLQHENWEIRRIAVEALHNMPASSDSTLSTLVRLAFSDSHDGVRKASIRTLTNYALEGESLLKSLIDQSNL